MKEDVRAVVMTIAAEVLELDLVEVREEHQLDDLGATSVTRLDLLVALERRFGVQFNVKEIEDYQQIKQIVDVVQCYVDMKQHAPS